MPRTMGDGALSDALKGLKRTLERACKLVAGFEKKNVFLRAVEADNIAVKLRRVYLDISLNLSAVVLANGAYNTSTLKNIHEIVEALRADIAHNSSMLAKIMEIVVLLPDALQHLGRQMEELVRAYYSNSTDVANCENKTRRETYKRGVSSRSEIWTEKKVTGPADDEGPFATEGNGLSIKSSQYGGGGAGAYSIVRSVPAPRGINQGIPDDAAEPAVGQGWAMPPPLPLVSSGSPPSIFKKEEEEEDNDENEEETLVGDRAGSATIGRYPQSLGHFDSYPRYLRNYGNKYEGYSGMNEGHKTLATGLYGSVYDNSVGTSGASLWRPGGPAVGNSVGYDNSGYGNSVGYGNSGYGNSVGYYRGYRRFKHYN